MKRFLALIAAGIMVCGACLVVSAAPGDSVSGNSISGNSAGGGSEYDAGSEAYALEIQAAGVSAHWKREKRLVNISTIPSWKFRDLIPLHRSDKVAKSFWTDRPAT